MPFKRQISFTIYLVLVLFVNNYCVGQNYCTSPPAHLQTGGFELSKITLCPGESLSIATEALGLENTGYDFTYNGQGLPAVHTKHQIIYTAPGQYTVLQQGYRGGVPTVACQTITVLPVNSAPEAPYINKVQPGYPPLIRLSIVGQSGAKYELWQGNAGQSLKGTGYQYTDGEIAEIPVTATGSVCFQLRDPTTCGSKAQSEIVCSINPFISATNKRNVVTWQPYQGTGLFDRWELYKNGQLVNFTGNNDPTTTRYDDQTDIECGNQYCYHLFAISGKTRIISSQACETGQNSDVPQPPSPVFVTLDGRDVAYVQATLPLVSSVDQFTIITSRADKSSGPYSVLASLPQTFSYRDNTGDFSHQSYCYQLTYRNRCGILSKPSPPACTIWLSSTSTTNINWTPESAYGADPVKNYYILFYVKETGQLVEERLIGNINEFKPDLNDPAFSYYEFRIMSVNQGNVRSYSNFYQFVPPTGIFIPTAFSPNGDQINDYLEIKGNRIKTYHLVVYNRWGNPVFSSDDQSNSWDGSVDGQPAPTGQYTYSLKIMTDVNQIQAYQGQVFLMR